MNRLKMPHCEVHHLWIRRVHLPLWTFVQIVAFIFSLLIGRPQRSLKMESKEDKPKNNSPAGRVSLPIELAKDVAAYLEPVDIIAMSDASDTLEAKLADEIHAITAEKEAYGAYGAFTLKEFEKLAALIEPLPRSLRARSLIELGYKIHRLPEEDQPDASNRFRSLGVGVGNSPELAEMIRISAHKTAADAVLAGEKLLAVSMFYNLSPGADDRLQKEVTRRRAAARED